MVWSNKGPAHVILRPVLLQKMAELVRPRMDQVVLGLRRRFADYLVMPVVSAAPHVPAR